jgi:hypothetical protein
MEYSSLLIAKPDWFAFDLKVRSERKKEAVVCMWDKVMTVVWEEEKVSALRS